MQERFIYTPYGVMTVLSTAWASVSDSYAWKYTFQGGRYDSITSMSHFGLRDCSTGLGGWLQPDPAGYVDGKLKR